MKFVVVSLFLVAAEYFEERGKEGSCYYGSVKNFQTVFSPCFLLPLSLSLSCLLSPHTVWLELVVVSRERSSMLCSGYIMLKLRTTTESLLGQDDRLLLLVLCSEVYCYSAWSRRAAFPPFSNPPLSSSSVSTTTATTTIIIFSIITNI